ncbi:MAG: class I SAM-dependent methyltransferase [Nannocystaceae bacterium]|nr:class I SAM-dependent methyltransferase [Nannocystaceae bacterium]
MTLAPRFAANDRSWVRLSAGQVAARERVLAKLASGEYAQASSPCFCGLPPHDIHVADRDRYGLPVRTVLCGNCGLMRSDPRLDAPSAARFYRDDYRDLYTGPGNGETLFESQRQRGEGLLRLLAKLVPQIDSVYEVGCGAGGLLAPFAAVGKRVAGVDLGDEYLGIGRAHGLTLVHGDASALLAHQGRPADLVLLMHVLEHYHDLRASVAEVATLVADGGVLLVEVPGLATIATHYRNDVLLYLQNAHNYHFTAATLQFVLRGCGLDVRACTDDGVALCVKPEAGQRVAPMPAPAGEAERVMRLLAELETRFAAAAGPRAA